MALVRKVRFDALFTFIYSPRKGTKAAEMVQNEDKETIGARFTELCDLQNTISKEIHTAHLGDTVRVLVDGEAENKSGYLSARTSGGRLVKLAGDTDKIGTFCHVRLTEATTWSFTGEPVEKA